MADRSGPGWARPQAVANGGLKRRIGGVNDGQGMKVAQQLSPHGRDVVLTPLSQLGRDAGVGPNGIAV